MTKKLENKICSAAFRTNTRHHMPGSNNLCTSGHKFCAFLQFLACCFCHYLLHFS